MAGEYINKRESRLLHDVVTRIVSRAAPEQGGVISGLNPVAFDKTDPIRIWIVQVVVIIAMAQFLSLFLVRIKQPKVIAEVIGGILLGPTVMGRIPKFSNSIFPADSLPYLNLTATIGLVLFLFLTALEVDVRIIKRNARSSLFISFAGILLPFGLGAAVAVPIYKNFVNDTVSFGHFLLFSGVALSITAFPVLCRILTELKLLDTNVGVTVLAAGVGNDVVGWILLALTVALVNASKGINALYILLSSVAWTLFLLFPVKWGYRWLAHRTGSIENGQPTSLMMIITLLIVFVSAFMTDILGVHAIFGGFIAGLIIPHEGGFAISMVEKLEDLITLILIPIYFTLSGLRTNLGLLDNGITWGYTILLCVVAFIGKFVGCAIAAWYCKFNIRESTAIGILMSCKGLVELIVLNIGLQAGILDQRLFSMFVVMALVMTFMTSPLAVLVYPESVRIHHGPVIHRAKDEEEKKDKRSNLRGDGDFKSKFSVVLHKLEHLPALMTLTQMLQPALTIAQNISTDSDEKNHEENSSQIDALRLIELSERTSAVMKSSEAEEIIHRDPLLAIFRTFGQLNDIKVSTTLSVVNLDGFPSSVAEHTRDKESDLVIVPWNAGSTSDEQLLATQYNPLEGIFGKAPAEKASSIVYSQFIRRTFATSPADVALFIDRGISHSVYVASAQGHHVILPFLGGPDDRLALSTVVQLCANPLVTATVFRVKKVEDDAISPVETLGTDMGKALNPHANATTVHSASGFPDTLYGQPTTQMRLESENADSLLYSRFAGPNASSTQPLSPAAQSALTRISFEDMITPEPLHKLIERIGEEHQLQTTRKKALLVVVGRGRRMAVESHHSELRTIIQEYSSHTQVGGEVSRTVGDIATAFIASNVKANLMVLQAANGSTQEE